MAKILEMIDDFKQIENYQDERWLNIEIKNEVIYTVP